MNFSRNTIVETMRVMHMWTTVNQFQEFLFRFSLESVAPASLGTKPSRINALTSHLLKNPEAKGPKGANLTLETIEYLLNWRSVTASNALDQCPELVRALELDGYSINENGKVVSVVPSTIALAQQQTAVEALLLQFGFTVADGHLKQALSAHARGDWAAANSQMRTFIESLFDCFADKLLNPPLPATSHGRREQLARLIPPFIDPAVNE